VQKVRHLVAGRKTSRVATGQFERTVVVWDMDTPRRISTFETSLDFGGQRLALSDGGDVVIAAAYHRSRLRVLN